MTFLLVFLWLLTALMMTLVAVRFYEKAPDDIRQVFHGCGGKKGVFLIVFLAVFILLAVVGFALRSTTSESKGGVYLHGGTSSEPLVKPLITIQPMETKGAVLIPEAPPIVKKPEPSITPIENEGKVRLLEPAPEIRRPASKKDRK
jgi:preprotein translocase subunit SecG